MHRDADVAGGRGTVDPALRNLQRPAKGLRFVCRPARASWPSPRAAWNSHVRDDGKHQRGRTSAPRPHDAPSRSVPWLRFLIARPPKCPSLQGNRDSEARLLAPRRDLRCTYRVRGSMCVVAKMRRARWRTFTRVMTTRRSIDGGASLCHAGIHVMPSVDSGRGAIDVGGRF